MDDTNNEAQHQRTQLLKIGEVQSRTQLSRASIYNHVKAGTFPAPVRLGKHSRWLESELEHYIGNLKAARQSEAQC